MAPMDACLGVAMSGEVLDTTRCAVVPRIATPDDRGVGNAVVPGKGTRPFFLPLAADRPD